ncbi:unnamed protein product [Leptosia nina]|uniref:Transcription factor Pcc1 n=1 Tax=Leptosia nina TaxID=320188 RepID=A0AAV1JUG3_9NEOP
MEYNIKKVSLKIPFPTNHYANITHKVLNVDKDLKGIKKEIVVEDNNLIIYYEGADYKFIRSALNAALKNVVTVLQTIQMF